MSLGELGSPTPLTSLSAGAKKYFALDQSQERSAIAPATGVPASEKRTACVHGPALGVT
jgi:hypothetical protein